MKEIEEIRKKLKKELDAYRYQHTLGVMYTAASLAMKYCEDLNDTMMAGILHDCAKCISDDEKMKVSGIPYSPYRNRNSESGADSLKVRSISCK